MTQHTQQGFAHLVLFVMILIILVVGGAGYYVWKKNQDKDKKTSSQSARESDIVANGNDHGLGAGDPAGFTLNFKEWSLTASGPTNLHLTHAMEADRRATFSADELTALDPACKHAGGSIVRFAGSDRLTADSTNGPTAAEAYPTFDKSRMVQVGNYYYLFEHDESACGNTEKTQVRQREVNDAVKAMLPTLKPAD